MSENSKARVIVYEISSIRYYFIAWAISTSWCHVSFDVIFRLELLYPPLDAIAKSEGGSHFVNCRQLSGWEGSAVPLFSGFRSPETNTNHRQGQTEMSTMNPE